MWAGRECGQGERGQGEGKGEKGRGKGREGEGRGERGEGEGRGEGESSHDLLLRSARANQLRECGSVLYILKN